MRVRRSTVQRPGDRQLVIRSLTPADAAAYRRHLFFVRRETDYLLPMPTERVPGIRSLAERLRLRLREPDGVLLGVFWEGRLLGVGTLSPYGRMQRVGHRCTLSISVRRAFWGQGIGSELLSRILALSGELGYRQAELNVDAENERATALYRRFGFKETGRVENALLHRDGTYGAEITMVCSLASR